MSKQYIHYWDKKWDDPKIRDKWNIPSEEFLDFFQLYPLPQNALDIGCGIGRHIKFLESKKISTVGVDNSPIALSMCSNMLKLNNIIPKVILADMRQLPFLSNSFDLAISLFTIHHGTLADVEKIILEIFRVLKNGGRGVINVVKYIQPIENELEIELRTYVRGVIENGIHHYFLRKEIISIVSLFKIDKFIETEKYFILHLQKIE